MSNNNPGFKTQAENFESLKNTGAPMTPYAICFRDTTVGISEKIVNIVDEIGIHQVEHCLIYPRNNKNGELETFDATLFFNTNLPGREVFPVGLNNSNARQTGNFLAELTGKNANGDFDCTNEFKKHIGPLAKCGRNGELVIKSVRDNKYIAAVECDFYSLIAAVLGVKANDNTDFAVIGCEPITNNKDGITNFSIVMMKELVNGYKSKKSGTNYKNIDFDNIHRRRY